MESIHPGRILRDELEARRMPAKQFAGTIDVPEDVLEQILDGRQDISTYTAMKIGKALDTSAEVWIDLQSRHDEEVVDKILKLSIERYRREGVRDSFLRLLLGDKGVTSEEIEEDAKFYQAKCIRLPDRFEAAMDKILDKILNGLYSNQK